MVNLPFFEGFGCSLIWSIFRWFSIGKCEKKILWNAFLDAIMEECLLFLSSLSPLEIKVFTLLLRKLRSVVWKSKAKRLSGQFRRGRLIALTSRGLFFKTLSWIPFFIVLVVIKFHLHEIYVILWILLKSIQNNHLRDYRQ